MTELNGEVARRAAVVALEALVGPSGEQEGDQLEVRARSSHHQRGSARPVAVIDLRSCAGEGARGAVAVGK